MKWMLCLLLASAAVPAQEPGTVGPKLGALGSDAEAVPSLEDLFTDVSRLMRRADPRQAALLRERLVWTDKRLSGLERLRDRIRAGVSLDIPEALLSRPLPGASASMLERERLELLDLQGRLRLAQQPAVAVLASRQPETAAPSAFGSALLGIDRDLPAPPESGAGTPEAVRRSADPEAQGKALQMSGDPQGALNAFSSIPEEQRTASVMYRMGQCLEKLQRDDEARARYREVQKADPEGVWGRTAAHRLSFLEKRRGTSGDQPAGGAR